MPSERGTEHDQHVAPVWRGVGPHAPQPAGLLARARDGRGGRPRGQRRRRSRRRLAHEVGNHYPSFAGSQRAPLSTPGPRPHGVATPMRPPPTRNTWPVIAGGLGAGEPRDQRGHVVGGAGVPVALGRRGSTGAAHQVLGHAGAGAGRDGVGGDAVAASSLAAIWSAWRCPTWRRRSWPGPGWRKAGGRRGVDDAGVDRPPALASAPPVGRRPAHGRERALEVDADDRVPLLLGHVEEHAVAQDAGVVDQHVEAGRTPRRPGRPGARRRPSRPRRRRWPQPRRPRPRSRRRLPGRARVGPVAADRAAQVVDHDVGALAGQLEGVPTPMPRPAPVTMATRPAHRAGAGSAALTSPPRSTLVPAVLVARLLGQAEHPLADDVALHLGGAAPDRADRLARKSACQRSSA